MNECYKTCMVRAYNLPYIYDSARTKSIEKSTASVTDTGHAVFYLKQMIAVFIPLQVFVYDFYFIKLKIIQSISILVYINIDYNINYIIVHVYIQMCCNKLHVSLR